jgi:hypothetical protein
MTRGIGNRQKKVVAPKRVFVRQAPPPPKPPRPRKAVKRKG